MVIYYKITVLVFFLFSDNWNRQRILSRREFSDRNGGHVARILETKKTDFYELYLSPFVCSRSSDGDSRRSLHLPSNEYIMNTSNESI